MSLMIRVIDKIGFAVLFILALQIPILADHYRQYLTGFYDATAEQVAQYQALADQFGYSSVQAMIETLQLNPNPLVQEDANIKFRTLESLNDLKQGLNTLNNGHYFEQAWYMLAPQHRATLSRVLENFSPSVPLDPIAVVFSLLTALGVNLLLWSPFWTVERVRDFRARRRLKRNPRPSSGTPLA